jgi:NADPH-dependent glutamate synthase beta subunit-like oxidoreductase/glutamate synthase domain-containing protein 3/NAD-dependent dihydropyrimidine dehydrogenase PreA subunit
MSSEANQDQTVYHIISGQQDGERIESRVLEEKLQEAVSSGERNLKILAFGQHGIGGRLWKAGDEKVHVRVEGPPGQRLGSMGFANTTIEVHGPASDDTGWLNAGAEIVVHGNAGNGTCNAMAQGIVRVAGNIGARGMTMTKANPRFAPPELWVLGSVGDYFGEFMAGGIAVVCGVDPQNADNVLGYRPFVGMVRGKAFFRGPHGGFSQGDARLASIDDQDWQWLQANINVFLQRIRREELAEELLDRTQWQMIMARGPHEKKTRPTRTMAAFHREVWDQELGRGGIIGDLSDQDRSQIPVVTTGALRRFVPVWENRKYAAPCEATCPSGIPVQQRWQLVRQGRMDEAVDLALSYTPFPATVCGYLCPNLCMSSCTRQSAFMAPVDIRGLGQASIKAGLETLPPLSGHKVAVIGGGPGGISVAWQLRRSGHEATVYDTSAVLGGKIASAIPNSRIPEEVVAAELERVRKIIPHVHLQQAVSQDDVAQLREDYDFVVLATGAQKPRVVPVPGNERLITALDFLTDAKVGRARVGKRVVIIGAGNVGCDVATEAHRLGAEDITLIDIQEPLSFGKEREEAEKVGAQFRWPCFTREITAEGVVLTDGELLPADTVFISIGDAPDLSFVPEDIATEGGFVVVNEHYQTTDARVFAIGDIAKPGLLTDAIGAGRKAASAIAEMLEGRRPVSDTRPMIDKNRISLEYFDPRILDYEDIDHCGSQCSSCGACRDCGICSAVCPYSAISREETADGGYEYVVDAERCIGCGFCAGACPCGIWDLVENTSLI